MRSDQEQYELLVDHLRTLKHKRSIANDQIHTSMEMCTEVMIDAELEGLKKQIGELEAAIQQIERDTDVDKDPRRE